MIDRRTAVDGRVVQYLEAGSGAPVVLLHGDGDSAWDWEGVMKELAATHRVIAVSLPGHGDSDSVGGSDPETFASFVVEVLDELGLDRVALVGHSLGGLVAIHVALAHPARLERVVLASSAGLGQAVNPFLAWETLPGMGEAAIAMTLAPLGAQQRVLLRSSMLFAQPWRIPPRWWQDQLRLGQRREHLVASVQSKRHILHALGQHHVVLDRLCEIAVPTLVVWGVLDQVVPFGHGHAAVQRLDDSRLELLQGCGHLAHVESPRQFVAVIAPFLNGHSPQVAPAP